MPRICRIRQRRLRLRAINRWLTSRGSFSYKETTDDAAKMSLRSPRFLENSRARNRSNFWRSGCTDERLVRREGHQHHRAQGGLLSADRNAGTDADMDANGRPHVSERHVAEGPRLPVR